ncbi:MAG TPA: type II toxin-antitoxin system MqsR family toxin [Candidatus Onthocola stercoravium]|nr:type II toxin-antitoxin system MqsR family toxin [Candidatus Onthocola stercoravium]
MNSEQIKLLSRMKTAIRNNNRRFKRRKDRDINEDLAKIGITRDIAWDIILSLNRNFYYLDTKSYYNQSNYSLTFKRLINGKMVYIKLSLEKDNNIDYVYCWSFHIDYDEYL